jgi:hypothetical protein
MERYRILEPLLITTYYPLFYQPTLLHILSGHVIISNCHYRLHLSDIIPYGIIPYVIIPCHGPMHVIIPEDNFNFITPKKLE